MPRKVNNSNERDIRMSSSRIVMKNSIIGMVAQMCSMVMGFVSQRFFLKYLGLEIVGINSVIGETLGFLAFAELGVGSAITYRLYKPLVNNDQRELTALMQLYRTLYQIIGVVVSVVGLALMIFLPVFINDANADMTFIYTAYGIQLFSTASSYFFAYKRSLIFVDQKQYVCKIIDISCNIFFSFVRIAILIFYHNYHIYLLVQLMQTMTSNIIISYYCDSHYQFMKNKTKEKFDDVKGMFRDTGNILFGKLAGYVYSSTDNLVISTFAGIVTAGGFSNYRYVTNAVKNLVFSMTDSITATIGNNIQEKSREESYEMLRKYTFIRFAVANIAATGLCICTDAFVGTMFGTQYIMDSFILWLIVIDIFIGIVYGPTSEFCSVLGYFRAGKYITAFGAVINLALSIGLVQVCGVAGVLIGTCVSQLFFWIAYSALLCIKYFNSAKKLEQMWMSYISYILLTVGEIAALYFMRQKFLYGMYNLWAFIIEGVLCVGVSVVLLSVCYCRTKEYQYLLNVIKGMVKKARK